MPGREGDMSVPFWKIELSFTGAQPRINPIEKLPLHLHPVTMPFQEAAASLTVVLADIACRKKDIMAILPELNVKISGFSLNYLPFAESRHDFIQEELNVSVSRKAMEYGRGI